MTDTDHTLLRYYNFSRYLRQQFGRRVHKITLHAGFTCPNRDGSAGTGGCTFCNNAGFSPNLKVGPAAVEKQLAMGIDEARNRRKADRFIAYFQAYTNTYDDMGRLRELYDVVWQFPEVVGMSIGTRPDCVSPEIIDLIAGYTKYGEVWLEYGLQSVHDRTLEAINRGHGYREFVDAIEMTRDRNIRICVHTILGLPGEDHAMMMDTHRRLADMPINGLKLHLLHIMRNTVMARQYAQGEIDLLSQSDFAELVVDILEITRPDVTIQRMHADAPPEVLVAPQWCLDKQAVLNEIRECLVRRDTWQGKALGCELADVGRPGRCAQRTAGARL